jgi:ribose transport system substrate-binding protein
MSDETTSTADAPENDGDGVGGLLDRRRLLVAAAAAAGVAAMSPRAFAGQALRLAGSANSKSIAFAQPDTSASVYPLLLKGAKSAADKRGYELLESHANHQLDNQINELNTWIGQQIGGIIVLPLDNNAMLPLIKKAHENNVKFLDYSDKALPGTDGWVIFNNLQGARIVGTDAGKWVNKTLGGKAEVALLTHEIQKTGRDRIHGGIAALKKEAPGAKVVAQHEGVLAAECLTVTQSLLQAHPNLNVILCIADDGALGAERAFMQTHPSKERQGQMYIAGWDGAIPVMEKILAGSVIRSTGALDLVGIGQASIDATANAIEGKRPTRINYPYVLVSQSPAGMKIGKKLLAKYGA